MKTYLCCSVCLPLMLRTDFRKYITTRVELQTCVVKSHTLSTYPLCPS